MKFKTAKILLVDDKPANLIALHAVLDSPSYELIDVASGFEALRHCDNEEFALIVLDVQMPGLDGFETAKRIKRIGKNKDTPIIFITAIHREDPFVKKGFESGAIDYFGKPFDPEILKAKVGIYTDLYLKTKRLEETKNLIEKHARFKSLLDFLPVGLIVTDVEGRILDSNEESAKIWGGPLKSDSLCMSTLMIRTLINGETVEEELVDIETAGGVMKSITQSSHPIKGQNGEILGAVVILQDIFARKKIVDEIERKAIRPTSDILV